MDCKYTFKKKEYDLKKIEKAQILFSNGDFIELLGKEIVDLDVTLYDRLVYFNNCYFPVGKSGIIKMQISDKKPKYDASSVYNQKEYLKDRKSYIEKVFVEEGVYAIYLFDELNWHDAILGNIVVKKEENFLIFSFLEYPSLGTSNSDSHFINLKNVNKKDFRVIHLDFENCDGIDVYQNEVKEINLNFEKELEWNSSGYCRVIKNGYIRLKFNKEYDFGRKTDLYIPKGKFATFKHLENRICGKGEDDVDMCHLYISNYHCGYGFEKEEVISLNNLSEYLGNYGEDDESEEDIPYISGYAKKQKDGSILITFGKKRQ